MIKVSQRLFRVLFNRTSSTTGARAGATNLCRNVATYDTFVFTSRCALVSPLVYRNNLPGERLRLQHGECVLVYRQTLHLGAAAEQTQHRPYHGRLKSDPASHVPAPPLVLDACILSIQRRDRSFRCTV